MMVLFLLVILGGGLAVYGGLIVGMSTPGQAHSGAGLALVGAIMMGLSGAFLWHWATALTTLVMFVAFAFAVFARKDMLDG